MVLNDVATKSGATLEALLGFDPDRGLDGGFKWGVCAACGYWNRFVNEDPGDGVSGRTDGTVAVRGLVHVGCDAVTAQTTPKKPCKSCSKTTNAPQHSVHRRLGDALVIAAALYAVLPALRRNVCPYTKILKNFVLAMRCAVGLTRPVSVQTLPVCQLCVNCVGVDRTPPQTPALRMTSRTLFAASLKHCRHMDHSSYRHRCSRMSLRGYVPTARFGVGTASVAVFLSVLQ